MVYIKRKGHLKGIPKHIESIQQSSKDRTKRKEGLQKKITHPHLKSNQSKILIKGKGSSSINILVQNQKLQTKELFCLQIESSSLSKAILFLSFQTIQKIHKGVAFHAFLCFFPTNESCQPRRVSLTVKDKTQDMSKRAKSNCHKTLALMQ